MSAADASVGTPDISFPDGPPRDGPGVCESDPPAVAQHDDPRGNFTLAVDPAASVRFADVEGADALTSAATIDIERATAGAFAVRAEEPTPQKALFLLKQRIHEHLPGAYVAVRASGTSGQTADGHPDVKEAIWDLSVTLPLDLVKLRNDLLAWFLGREPAQLSNLPSPGGEAASAVVLKLTAVDRSDQTVVSFALAARSDYQDEPSGATRRHVDDLGNGTAITSAGRTPEVYCDRGPVTGQAVADILWIVDESGSMNDNRDDIVANANRFFAKAKAAGLDFRMGVAGMKNPNQPDVTLGKLCSVASDDPEHDGGEDRFLLPEEQAIFSSCVRNPPYLETGSEYGLAHAYHAVERLLPRAESSPNRIRTGAKLALIIVTDEAPQELKMGGVYDDQAGFMTYADYRSSACELTKERRKQLDTYLEPWIAYFSGDEDPEAEATVHLIGGICNNGCKAEVPHGYQDLAERLGGQSGDVCQENLGATLQEIIDSIVASASPRVLHDHPISSTLQIEVDGVRISRSHARGFAYSAATNSLSFFNVKIVKGTQVSAVYLRFK